MESTALSLNDGELVGLQCEEREKENVVFLIVLADAGQGELWRRFWVSISSNSRICIVKVLNTLCIMQGDTSQRQPLSHEPCISLIHQQTQSPKRPCLLSHSSYLWNGPRYGIGDDQPHACQLFEVLQCCGIGLISERRMG
jgi:hypothetical protein